MARPTLVLLVPGDPLTGLLTESGLTSYGYDVVMTLRPDEAQAHLQSQPRIKVLVVDADLPDGSGLARFARSANPAIQVIYTLRAPSRIREGELVQGAPCLRVPYHPHQLVGVIGGLLRRPSGEDGETNAA
jgi:DNA-binding response OmpR family regulator